MTLEREIETLTLTGIDVPCSRIGIGTFSSRVGMAAGEVEDYLTVAREAFEGGISCIHTCPAFPSVPGAVIGRAIKPYREKLIVMSYLLPNVVDPQAIRQSLVSAIDDECARLSVEHIDVLQLAPWQLRAPLVDVVDVLADLVRSGRIRAVGLNSPQPIDLAQASWLREAKDAVMLAMIQDSYSVLSRTAESVNLDAAELLGMPFYASNPLAGGILSGRFRSAEARGTVATFHPEHQSWTGVANAVERLSGLAHNSGMSLPELAIGWLFSVPAVSGAFCFPRTPAQLRHFVDASHRRLSADILAEVDAIVPPRNALLWEAYGAVEAAEQRDE